MNGMIDFMIAPLNAATNGVPYTRPYRVLVDKDGLGVHLAAAPDPAARPPTAAEFLACSNAFYAAALMCAKCIVRDEPWMAKLRDWDLKTELLRMIVWDHKARYGWDYDAWHNGQDVVGPAVLARRAWAARHTRNVTSPMSSCGM